jgi:hypothetical protein
MALISHGAQSGKVGPVQLFETKDTPAAANCRPRRHSFALPRATSRQKLPASHKGLELGLLEFAAYLSAAHSTAVGLTQQQPAPHQSCRAAQRRGVLPPAVLQRPAHTAISSTALLYTVSLFVCCLLTLPYFIFVSFSCTVVCALPSPLVPPPAGCRLGRPAHFARPLVRPPWNLWVSSQNFANWKKL